MDYDDEDGEKSEEVAEEEEQVDVADKIQTVKKVCCSL